MSSVFFSQPETVVTMIFKLSLSTHKKSGFKLTIFKYKQCPPWNEKKRLNNFQLQRFNQKKESLTGTGKPV